ncbi:hypothetical protein E2C01_070643 [Portunus trituberculatus]|uniref:CCHC-type domain-containing protein n=1 Tax=Portunus trituberculatus TaxID=210409 RepID=A0A5B7I2N4_PORTR|nr:hypothetical protein [Portunus trituberculatus]
MCFRCWRVGHISRYCSASERCAWCASDHDSDTCPHRTAPPPLPASPSAATATEPPTQPPSTNIHWKCPRCNKQGVNAWHECAKRPVKQPAPHLLHRQSLRRSNHRSLPLLLHRSPNRFLSFVRLSLPLCLAANHSQSGMMHLRLASLI